MIVNGRLLVERYVAARGGHKGVRAVRRQFDAWLEEALEASWRSPAEVKAKFATASILRDNRVVFNISGNKYRLVVKVNHPFGVIDIRFFGSHAEYDRTDAETV